MRERPREAQAASALWRGFLSVLSVLSLLQIALLGYLFAGPVAIAPHAWEPAANPDLTGPYTTNDALTRGRRIPTLWVEPGARDLVRYRGVGPETVAVGPDGYLYAGLCDAGLDGRHDAPPECRLEGKLQGWIVRLDPRRPRRVQPYVQTGGRPLGLAFDDRGRLYVADAERGLLRVESDLSGEAAATPLAEVQAPLHAVVKVATCSRDDDRPDVLPDFTDSVDIGPDGTVFFTCPSQRWPLAKIRNDVLESQPTGRVVRYQPCPAPQPLDCPKQVIADGLMFANGIAVWPGGDSLLVNEWTGYRVTRLRLDEARNVRSKEVFFDNAPGYPDNVSIDRDGTVWVGLVIRRNPIVDRLHPHPFLMSALARLPDSSIKLVRHAWVIGLDANGKLKHNLQDATGFFNQATGAYPVGDALYVASNTETALLCVPRPGAGVDHDPCDPWARSPENMAVVTRASVVQAEFRPEPLATSSTEVMDEGRVKRGEPAP